MNWLVISPTYNQDFFTCMTVAFKDTLKETSDVQLEKTKMYWKKKKKHTQKGQSPTKYKKRCNKLVFLTQRCSLLFNTISSVKVIQTFLHFKNCFSQYEAWTDVLFQIWF